MLNELKFVNRAVMPTASAPIEYSSLYLYPGTVRATNGAYSMGADLNLDLNCVVNGKALVNAVAACDGKSDLHFVKNPGSLTISAGGFTTNLPCLKGLPCVPEPPIGSPVDLDLAGFFKALKTCLPFSRGVVNGGSPALPYMWLSDRHVITSDNRVLIKYDWGKPGLIKPVPIPALMAKQIVSLKKPPNSIFINAGWFVCDYDIGWLACKLPDIAPYKWDHLTNPLENPIKLPKSFFENLEALKPMVIKQGLVYIKNGVVSTSPLSTATSFQADYLNKVSCMVNLHSLLLLKRLNCDVDFKECGLLQFKGENIEGVIKTVVL